MAKKGNSKEKKEKKKTKISKKAEKIAGKKKTEKIVSATAKEKLKAFEEKKPVKAIKEKNWFNLRTIPAYLWILFFVLGIAGGIALSTYFQPEPEPIIFTPPIIEPDKPLEIELIYSNECSFCVKHNTIFDTFDFYEIEFTVKEIEASSLEGKEKIAIFEPGILPAAIVPEQGLKKFAEIKEAMEQSFRKKEGFFVVPESNLDSSKLYSRMYIEPVYPSDCDATNPNSNVILFDDPYNEIMIKTQPVLNQILTEFNDFAVVKFEFIPSNINTLAPDADPILTQLAPNHLVCASAQDLFLEGYNRMLSIYCGGTDLALTQKDIEFCELSPHFGTPLDLKEIEAATFEMEAVTRGIFDSCLGIADELNKSSILRALEYGITRTGTAIVDCRYSVPYQAIGLAICETHPEIEPCKTNE